MKQICIFVGLFALAVGMIIYVPYGFGLIILRDCCVKSPPEIWGGGFMGLLFCGGALSLFFYIVWGIWNIAGDFSK